MRRRSVVKPALTLSLFPFLAVLICTMGALIVLLVIVLHKARADATEVASRSTQALVADDEQLAGLRLQKEDQEWRRSELEKQRTEYQQQLTQQRLTLSHFEQHIRQLEEQWKQLSAQAQELTRIGSQQSSGSDEKQQTLKALQDDITKQRDKLTEAQREAAGRQRTFCIIPYDGPNGTKRRPIYVECTDQGIVLQPEGVVLTPADFTGSLGAGNPLDAALRTIREYWAKYGDAASQGEPYPLLIVRPNGTVAYAAARAALKSWDDQFGYELVEADLKLAYPKPDPALTQELQRSIQDARQRQEVLASIMPGRYRQSGPPGLVASSSGGFTPISGVGTGLGTGSGAGGGIGSTSTPDGQRPGGGSPDDGSPTGGLPSGRQPGGRQPGGGPPSGGSFTRTFGSGNLEGDDRAISMQAAQRSAAGSKGGRSGKFSQQSSGYAESNGPQAGNPGSTPNTPASPFGQPGLPGASRQTADNDSAATGSDQNASSQNASSQSSPGKNRGSAGKTPPGMQPLANSRGADWGLPNRGATTTGIQRFVQIECYADRLVILQDRADYRSPTVIPMHAETAASMDPFVAAMWNRMEQWGLAADGCYWKPVLRVHVQPDGEQRFAELSTLLDYSGVVVQRKD